ncbi:hypothetical protein VNO78_05131 [Psophocarpus tetragonolobus]|uniref:Uncharacterized protein n=1 Tax=Psophocarpus tetragonolobus TaxID=3891 RepID=A0AAN9SQJ6_PSOTE
MNRAIQYRSKSVYCCWLNNRENVKRKEKKEKEDEKENVEYWLVTLKLEKKRMKGKVVESGVVLKFIINLD